MESSGETSVFQTKYNEFVEDLMGALPEYSTQIQAAKALDDKTRLSRFQEEVKVGNTMAGTETDDFSKNPGKILPGVDVSNTIWGQLSDNTKKAIWEYVRILSICCFMEAGFSDTSRPEWMEEAMNDMKKKLDGVDFQNIIKKFMTFLKPGDNESDSKKEGGAAAGGAGASGIPGLEGLFSGGFPKLPEKFLKGQLAKLAQEIVKDITPEDLGISKEMMEECEKTPSRAFDLLFTTFSKNPGIIQKTVQKIGKSLQQKIVSGAIRPQEIAREAEELIKEFSENSSFVEMLSGLKSAFGFEDMDLARQAGREGSARLATARERLRKKASEKEAKRVAAVNQIIAPTPASLAESEALMAELLREEPAKKKAPDTKKKPGKGGKK